MREIFLLSLRQLTGKWRLMIVFALGILPVVMAATRSQLEDPVLAEDIDEVLINALLVSAVLPLVALAAASASFANEIEDRTLSNLTLTPLKRWQIVLPKLAAAFTASLPVPLISGVISLALLLGGSSGIDSGSAIAALVVGLVAGVAIYSAVFVLIGLMTVRALWFGLLYIFLWEGLVSQFVAGVRYFSIRQYVIGIIHGVDDSRFADTVNLLSAPIAFGMMGVVIVAATLLSIRHLRRMDIP